VAGVRAEPISELVWHTAVRTHERSKTVRLPALGVFFAAANATPVRECGRLLWVTLTGAECVLCVRASGKLLSMPRNELYFYLKWIDKKMRFLKIKNEIIGCKMMTWINQ
jgi:hypothetical protein